MKASVFVRKIFKRFPLLLTGNILLSAIMSLFTACSLFTISPLVDFLVHPDLKNVSPLTERAVGILKFFSMPATLWSWLIVFVSFVALSSLFQVFARYSILKTKYAVLRDIILGTFKDFFAANWYFFASGKQGVLLNTFTRELTTVGDAFGAMALFFASALQTVFFLSVPFCISWQVTVVSIGVSLLFAVPFILLGGYSYRLGVLNTKTSNRTKSVIQENISLAKIVLGFGKQRKSVDSLASAFDVHRNATLRSQFLSIAIPILYNPFGVIMVIVALFTARRFNVPLSELMVLLLALRQVAFSVGNLTAQKNSLENFFPSYEQIENLRKRARQFKQKSGIKQFNGIGQELSLEHVSFSYPGHGEILSDINIRVPKGKMIAFVGGSGAGKSTLVDIILGFHEPSAGRVLCDGIFLEEFEINSFREKIGYVPQDSVLFNMTIKDNLLWALESAKEGEIIQACIQANADEFIRQLPHGYDTLAGDRGVRLSGGQVQRIALARAILRKPDLLVLDEATSALDTHSEKLIQQAIETIAKKTTVIVIAHRLSTIVNADYVYVLDEGRVIEEGTYSGLMKSNGHFNRMVELQVL